MRLVTSFVSVLGIGTIIKGYFTDLSWWDYVKFSVIATAQLTAWFATDGAAFIAEVALVIMNAEQLIESAADWVANCACE